MKFLVIGCGSIGERHIRNLKGLSAEEILAHDLDIKRLNLMKEKYEVSIYKNIEKAWEQKPDVVLVCTPPSSHIPLSLTAINYGANVFIEKPLSNTLKGVDKLLENAREKNLAIFVGYNFRFHKGIQLVKEMVDSREIGKILFARAEFGQYLPDWRPWQDYRQSYTAKRDLGGGIILDGSHEIDYMRWILGDTREICCFAGKISNLEVETEDVAEILIKFKTSVIGEIHLDFVKQSYSRTCEIVGEEGIIQWSYQDRGVNIYSEDTKKWKTINIKDEPNDMYIRELEHFINCIKNGEKPLIDGEEGKKTLRLALLAKQSSETKRVIKV
jgi:predicted dehydrogenase